MQNRRGELICRHRRQDESESQQKKSRSCETSRSSNSARKKAHVWCIRRGHYPCRTSDDTLTDYGLDESRDLSGVAPAKQEVAGQANQGSRPDPDSSHFTGFHAVLVSIVPIMIFSLCVVGR